MQREQLRARAAPRFVSMGIMSIASTSDADSESTCSRPRALRECIRLWNARVQESGGQLGEGQACETTTR